MAGEVTDLIRKRKAGESLDDADRALYNEKQKASMRRSKRIYFPNEETLEEFLQAARAAQPGRKKPDFSAWVVEMLTLASDGRVVHPDLLAELEREKDEAILDAETERRKANQYFEERNDANEKLADLTERMITVMESLGLPAGGK